MQKLIHSGKMYKSTTERYYYITIKPFQDDKNAYIVYSTPEKDLDLKVNTNVGHFDLWKNNANIIGILYSSHYDENLLDALSKYYKPLCVYYKNSNSFSLNEYYKYYKSYKEQISTIDKFIEEHDNTKYTHVDIITLHTLIDKSYQKKDKKLIDNFVQLHNQEFSDNSTFTRKGENIRYLRPYYIDFTNDEAETLHCFPDNSKYYSKTVMRDMFKLSNIIEHHNSYKDSDLIKDVTIKHDLTAIYHITKFPMHNKEFNDYMNNLTVGEFKKLWQSYPSSVAIKDAINIAEIIIHNDKYNITVTEINDCFNNPKNIKKYVSTSSSNLEYLEKLKKWCVTNAVEYKSKKHTVYVLVNYFNNSKIIDNVTMNNIINNIMKNTDRWCSNGSVSDYVVFQLLENNFSPTEIINLITDVVDCEKSLTVKKWEEYINNKDEYNDMPTSWWLAML